MTIGEFRNTMYEQIKLSTSTGGTSDKEEFVTFAIAMLTESEELNDEFVYLPHEGIGPRRKLIQIDGYAYNELDDYLIIFICLDVSMDVDVSTPLTNTDAEKAFSKARGFIEHSRYILENAEESSPGYGLADDIVNKYTDVQKYAIILLTDMPASKSIKNIEQSSLNGKPVEYQIWDIERLYRLSESKSGKEDIVIKISDYLPDGLPCLPASKTDDYEAYLCNIPGSMLAALYNQHGGRLLEGNVRSFLQTKGKVNKGIRATILNEPEMFFAYNNGIAATASDLKIENRSGVNHITEITALQIVNGGQTTASLAMALIKDKRDDSEEKIKHIYVPMKLSVVSPEKAQELIPNISRYANSQNKVSDADLWSNHPFHVRMESFSRRLLAPAIPGRSYGTYWYYERATGQYRSETYKATEAKRKQFELQNPKQQLFNKTDLAKYHNIYRCLPHVASTGGQKSFAKFAEWAATQWAKDENVFNEAFFRRITSIVIIFRNADRIVKTQTWYNSYKANIVAYTMSMIFYLVRRNYPDKAIDYKSIWSKQSLSTAWTKQIENTSKIMYSVLVDENRPVENVTEWAKRETCWNNAIEIQHILNADFINELIYKSREIEQQTDAREEQKLTKKVTVLMDVVEYGVANWKTLLEWAGCHEGLHHYDVELIKAAVNIEANKIPTEKNCRKILDVLEKARTEGYPN